MKIYELPGEIQNRVFQLQTEAGNTPNANLNLLDKKSEGNFDWASTPEGLYFWKGIEAGWYRRFYEKYPNKPVEIYSPAENGESFVKHLIAEIFHLSPIALSENNREDLEQTMFKVLDGYNLDQFQDNRVQIEEAFKRKTIDFIQMKIRINAKARDNAQGKNDNDSKTEYCQSAYAIYEITEILDYFNASKS